MTDPWKYTWQMLPQRTFGWECVDLLHSTCVYIFPPVTQSLYCRGGLSLFVSPNCALCGWAVKYDSLFPPAAPHCKINIVIPSVPADNLIDYITLRSFRHRGNFHSSPPGDIFLMCILFDGVVGSSLLSSAAEMDEDINERLINM